MLDGDLFLTCTILNAERQKIWRQELTSLTGKLVYFFFFCLYYCYYYYSVLNQQ